MSEQPEDYKIAPPGTLSRNVPDEQPEGYESDTDNKGGGLPTLPQNVRKWGIFLSGTSVGIAGIILIAATHEFSPATVGYFLLIAGGFALIACLTFVLLRQVKE